LLADPGGCQQDPLGVPFRGPGAARAPAGDLVARLCFEHRQVEFILAEQREVAAG
jgi:hypothetical protein